MDFLRQAGDADIVTFSPFPCHAAVFVNVFEQGEFSSIRVSTTSPGDFSGSSIAEWISTLS